MGSGYSVDSSYGFIAVQMGQQKHFPGGQVNGWIYLNLIKPFQTNQLQVLLTGKEKTKVVYVTQSNSGNSHHENVHVDKGRREFFAYHYEIPSHLPDQFPAGQYSYPFSFLLPPDLPPSFAYLWNDRGHPCYGKIEYRVKAVLIQERNRKMLLDKSPILVDRLPSQLPATPPQGIFEEQVKGYCGTDKGFLRIRSLVEKSEYQVGEAARIQTEVDASQMIAGIKYIRCCLRQYLTVTGSSHTHSTSNDLSSQDFPGIAPGQIMAGSDALRFSLPIQTNGPFQSNVEGQLVKCRYVLEQLCEVDRCQCCNDDAKSSLPIVVVNPPMTAFQLPPIQPGVVWQPQMMPPTIFAASPQYAYNEDFRRKLTMFKQA